MYNKRTDIKISLEYMTSTLRFCRKSRYVAPWCASTSAFIVFLITRVGALFPCNSLSNVYCWGLLIRYVMQEVVLPGTSTVSEYLIFHASLRITHNMQARLRLSRLIISYRLYHEAWPYVRLMKSSQGTGAHSTSVSNLVLALIRNIL